MSEMLGNQYFMARKYTDALAELEPCLAEDPQNKSIKRKLVICYTQTGKNQKAMDLFIELVDQDIEFILTADPIKDDCPCNELVENLEKQNLPENGEFYTLSGILWLYCDLQSSIDVFEKALTFDLENKTLQYLIKKLNFYKDQKSLKLSS